MRKPTILRKFLCIRRLIVQEEAYTQSGPSQLDETTGPHKNNNKPIEECVTYDIPARTTSYDNGDTKWSYLDKFSYIQNL